MAKRSTLLFLAWLASESLAAPMPKAPLGILKDLAPKADSNHVLTIEVGYDEWAPVVFGKRITGEVLLKRAVASLAGGMPRGERFSGCRNVPVGEVHLSLIAERGFTVDVGHVGVVPSRSRREGAGQITLLEEAARAEQPSAVVRIGNLAGVALESGIVARQQRQDACVAVSYVGAHSVVNLACIFNDVG